MLCSKNNQSNTLTETVYPIFRDEEVAVPTDIRNLGYLNYMTPFHKEVCIDTVINTKNQSFSCHAFIEQVRYFILS